MAYTFTVNKQKLLTFFWLLIVVWPVNTVGQSTTNLHQNAQKVITGAEQTGDYFPLLQNMRVALVSNQTSMIGQTHLLDSLVASGIEVVVVFTPEHGFRGEVEAGEKVSSEIDKKTNIRLVSLYGKNFKPSDDDLSGIDYVVFDIQDVGVRFYTYISTLHYVMEACAKKDIRLMILDRPNPNGHYIDGPVLEPSYKSFVGMHPVPIVHGMTIAEYALMINGEGWLPEKRKCELTLIRCKNYDHTIRYNPPVKPSPNLPNLQSIELYPSLCLFEGTYVSVGRGTPYPFQVFGHPLMRNTNFQFIPRSTAGAKNPPLMGLKCNGVDLRKVEVNGFTLDYVIFAYRNCHDRVQFFNPFFLKLCGTSMIKEAIVAGLSEDRIRQLWKSDVDRFKQIRKQYLLYPDFE